MGFKRTSEGRVFFQNGGETANDGPNHKPVQSQKASPRVEGSKVKQAPKSKARPLPKPEQYTQIQVLTLLKGLNDKLKNTQAERNQMRRELDRYRMAVEALEEKSENNEKAYNSLKRKIVSQPAAGGEASGGDKATEARAIQAEKIARETLSELKETRELLFALEGKADRADRTAEALKSLQKDQAHKVAKTVAGYAQMTKRLQENEERQDTLDGRIEEAVSQQARLVRKIDKSLEDRARFMRKIERIEEAVVQTRDSINAKAMVLLTDQGAAAKIALEDMQGEQGESDAAALLSANSDYNNNQALNEHSFWQRPASRQIGGALALGVVGILAGWFISEAQKPNIPDLSSIDAQLLNQIGVQAPLQTSSVQDGSALAADNAAGENWQIEQDTSRFSVQDITPAAGQNEAEIPYQAPPINVGAADDIGTLNLQNDEELLKALEQNPDKVAAALNDIEPGAQRDSAQAATNTSSSASTQDSAASEGAIETASLSPADLTPETSTLPTAVIAPSAPTSPATTQPQIQAFETEAPRGNGIPASVKSDSSLPDVIKNIEAQALQGVAEAQHDLAAVYTAGHAGVKQDYDRAAYWFKQAADQGIGNAAYNLGVLNHQGLGMKKDLDEAIRWYSLASNQGHPEAQYNLGIAFIEGIGVPYDAARAASYFENAAGQGVTEAAYNLGLIYENGLLGTPQPDNALVWYKAAADAGSPEAKAALEQLAKTLGIKIEDINKLADSVKKGANATILEKQNPSSVQQAAYSAKPANSDIGQPVALTAQRSEPLAFSVSGQEQALVAQVQDYLVGLGLYPGPADGVLGPLTSDSIRSYQSLNQLTVTGEPTPALLNHMLENANIDGALEYGSREY